MAGKPILLALGDREELEKISKYLGDKGFEYVSTTDGSRAIEMALRSIPSLMIVDVNLPVINGERLFQILKNNPKTVNVPFLFISEEQMEIKGFRVRKDLFLTSPFQWEELYGGIKQAQLLSGEGTSITDKDIQGKLSQMSLVDILQILHFNKKDGELTITAGDYTGIISIKDGQIYNAKLGDGEKEKALYRLLTWKDGRFEFHPCPVTTPQRIHTSTGNLLMEGMRQLDEFEKAKSLFPDADSILKTRIDTSTLPKGLKPIIYEILFLIEYYPKTKDLVDHCSFPDYEVYKTLVNLLTRRIIEEIKGKREEKEVSGGFISPTMAIRVKERVINRWVDMLSVNFGRLFLISSKPSLTKEFLLASKCLPDFSVDRKLAASKNSNENFVGEMGVLKLYGDMDVIFFPMPATKSIAPFLMAFLTNLIGLVILLDEESEDILDTFVALRNAIVSQRRVPVLYVYAGKKELDRELVSKYRNQLNLKHDDLMFGLTGKTENIFRIFHSFFNELTKEDYIVGH